MRASQDRKFNIMVIHVVTISGGKDLDDISDTLIVLVIWTSNFVLKQSQELI